MADSNPYAVLDTDRSQSTAGMQELEPSPVDETPAEETAADNWDPSTTVSSKEYFPATTSSPRSSTSSTLGLSSTSVPQLLLALQKYSTIPPTIYLAMHLTNTALIPLATRSLSSSDKYLLLTRPYYQSFPLEPLLIFVPTATHVLSGIALRFYRRRQSALRHGADTHADRRTIPWPKLSLTSALGYALYPFLAAHVYMNRLHPLKHDGGSSGVGLRYFAHGISKHPVLLTLGYGVMLGVASWHFVGGTAKFLKWSSDYVTEQGEDGVRERTRRKRIVGTISVAVWLVWAAGGLGVVGRGGRGSGWEARHWDDLLLQVPLVGSWL